VSGIHKSNRYDLKGYSQALNHKKMVSVFGVKSSSCLFCGGFHY
jgi:hypothetical protein